MITLIRRLTTVGLAAAQGPRRPREETRARDWIVVSMKSDGAALIPNVSACQDAASAAP